VVRWGKTFLTILIKVLVATKDHHYINLANLKHLINNFGQDGSNLDELIFKYADEKTFSEWKGFVSGNMRTKQNQEKKTTSRWDSDSDYVILGISENTTKEEAEEIFKKINRAYENLG